MSFSVNAESQKISPPVRNIPCFSHFIVLDQCRCYTLILKVRSLGMNLFACPYTSRHICVISVFYMWRFNMKTTLRQIQFNVNVIIIRLT